MVTWSDGPGLTSLVLRSDGPRLTDDKELLIIIKKYNEKKNLFIDRMCHINSVCQRANHTLLTADGRYCYDNLERFLFASAGTAGKMELRPGSHTKRD